MPAPPGFARLREPALALLIGLAGGLLFSGLGVPLGWLLGAMFATAAATISGIAAGVPPLLRSAVITMLGLSIGGRFELDQLAAVGHWLPSVALLVVYVLLVGALSLMYLRRFAGLGPRTAFFAATPGGLAEMVLLSDRMGADVRSVALVHATRVLLIVAFAPIVMELLEDVPQLATSSWTPGLRDLLILTLAGVAGALVARRLALPAAELMAPMLLSAALHLSGAVTAQLPLTGMVFAQITIGAAIGTRFHGLGARRVLEHALSGLGLTLLMFAISALFALILHLWTGLPFVALVLAYVPGGVVEMGTIALALGVDPAFVTTHHLIRLGLVVSLAPLLFPLWQRWGERDRQTQGRP